VSARSDMAAAGNEFSPSSFSHNGSDEPANPRYASVSNDSCACALLRIQA